jgi:hypothetical protein
MQAGQACKVLELAAQAAQAEAVQAEAELAAQAEHVQGLREAWAALGYLAVTTYDEPAQAAVYVQGAQVLQQQYPDTPFFQAEGAKLVAAMQASGTLLC